MPKKKEEVPEEPQQTFNIEEWIQDVEQRFKNLEDNQNGFIKAVDQKINSVIQAVNTPGLVSPAADPRSEGLGEKKVSNLNVNELVGVLSDGFRQLRDLGLVGSPKIQPTARQAKAEYLLDMLEEQTFKRVGVEIGKLNDVQKKVVHDAGMG
jgi:hypothetical protein